MSHKQKLGYTLLGAGIMAIGITIGQFITPSIEARNNGVFDKVVCREIMVMDKNGKKAIVLESDEFGNNEMSVYCSKTGKEAIWLGSMDLAANYMIVRDRKGHTAISLMGGNETNNVSIMGKTGNKAIDLTSTVYPRNDFKNSVRVYDRIGKAAFTLEAGELMNIMSVSEKQNDSIYGGNAFWVYSSQRQIGGSLNAAKMRNGITGDTKVLWEGGEDKQ